MTRALRCALVGILCLVTPPARAAEPAVTVVAVPGSGPDAARSAALADEVTRLLSAHGVATRTDAKTAVGRLDRARAEQARAAAAAARRLLDEMRTKEAARALEAAARGLEAELAYLGSGELPEALVALGVARGLEGDEAGARDAFRRALVLRPTLTYDTRRHPPALAPLFGKAHTALRRARKGGLAIVAPDDADVFVDGAPATGPTQDGLLPGEHFVVAVVPGHLPAVARVVVEPHKRAQVTLGALEDGREAVLSAALAAVLDGDPPAAQVAAACQIAETPRLLVLRARADGLADVALVDTRAKRRTLRVERTGARAIVSSL